MITDEILTAAGFEKNKTYRETRFITPPHCTYAVYFDETERRGGDYINLIKKHNVEIEVYEYSPDEKAQNKIEKAFDVFGLEYSRSQRYWIETEQLYQTIYSFEYTIKED